MLVLVLPTCLHLATACVQVVELTGAAKAKTARVVTATNKRMNGIPVSSNPRDQDTYERTRDPGSHSYAASKVSPTIIFSLTRPFQGESAVW
jgi:hypothetical protein